MYRINPVDSRNGFSKKKNKKSLIDDSEEVEESFAIPSYGSQELNLLGMPENPYAKDYLKIDYSDLDDFS